MYSTVKSRVGIYKDKNGHKVVIKRCQYTVEDLNLVYLRNEAQLLKTLTHAGSTSQILPPFIEVIEKPNEFILVTGFAEGERLDLLEQALRIDIVAETYEKLQSLSAMVKEHAFKDLPVRNPMYYLVSFMMNLGKLLFKDLSYAGFYLKMTALFYAHYIWGSLRGIDLGLVHRDLYADNILYSVEKKSITLLDWESAIVSDSLYDLAQIAMIYTQEMGVANMIELLKKYIANNAQRHRFIGLAIFNSLQILANNNTEDEVFKSTKKFLELLYKDVIPQIMYKKSPFEIINALTLDAIFAFYSLTGLPMRDAKKKIILCYHSVGNDGWRFSTRTNTFSEHLTFLDSKYNLVSLPELLKSQDGGVHISFDDGYANVVTNALPLLEQHKAVATMFAIGDSAHANRKELDNALPIMTDSELLMLRSKGWEIGYHTYTHANLGTLSDAQLKDELIEGKLTFEKKLGITLTYFAYPKGIYTEKVVQYVKKAGFGYAFTVDGKDMSLEHQDKLLLDRVPIEGELTASQLGALMSPLGLFTSKLFMKILVFKERYITSRLRAS